VERINKQVSGVLIQTEPIKKSFVRECPFDFMGLLPCSVDFFAGCPGYTRHFAATGMPGSQNEWKFWTGLCFRRAMDTPKGDADSVMALDLATRLLLWHYHKDEDGSETF
jgi:hypothetical protein